MSTSMLGASKRDMSGAPSRVKGRLLFSKHGNGKETTRDSSNQVLSTSLTTSPQTHHHQQHRRGLQENTTRLKATLLAVIAAAVMGGFTVASSELTNITPPGVSAVSLSAADRGRYSEQQLGSGTAASHGQPGLGNVYRPPVAGHTVERAAWEQPHEFIETSSKGGSSHLRDFPLLEESTVMFLHVFKCAGSTLRRMMVAWAEEEGQSGAIVVDCDDLNEDGIICLKNHKLLNAAVQEDYVAKQKVLAGHFFWGFQQHVRTPYLMITALRNPLEVFVSGQQFMHRKQTKTLEEANEFVSWVMAKKLRYEVGTTPAADVNYRMMAKAKRSSGKTNDSPEQFSGYIRRFIGVNNKKIPEDELETSVKHAMANMDTFWVVGVVEQYAGFEAVLMRLLDPAGKHAELWETYAVKQYNTSPVKTRDVLSAIDPSLVQEFNGSLAFEWRLYEKSLELWDGRCREILPAAQHQDMCVVPPALQEYTPTQRT